jgi:hypothetical protein
MTQAKASRFSGNRQNRPESKAGDRARTGNIQLGRLSDGCAHPIDAVGVCASLAEGLVAEDGRFGRKGGAA